MSKTNKIQLWIIVLLTILNLSTIGAIIYHRYEDRKNNEGIIFDNTQKNPINGKYFRKIIKFDNRQMKIFRNANREFQPKAHLLISQIDSLKIEMFKELNKETTDTLILNKLSSRIGENHKELKKITNTFYLKIKATCDSTQYTELKKTFLPLYQNESLNSGRESHRNIHKHLKKQVKV